MRIRIQSIVNRFNKHADRGQKNENNLCDITDVLHGLCVRAGRCNGGVKESKGRRLGAGHFDLLLMSQQWFSYEVHPGGSATYFFVFLSFFFRG